MSSAKSIRARYARLLLIGIILPVAGCAGTKVGKIQTETSRAILTSPRTITVIVENDSLAPKRISRRAEQLANAQNTVAALSESISKLLNSRALVVVPTGRPADLVLQCRIMNVRGGNEALRVLIGYGAGKAVLQVDVSLRDLRTGTELLSFETNSTTGGLPGAGLGVTGGLGSGNILAAIGPATSVPGALKQGLPQEVAQTTNHIDQELEKYFLVQHWHYAKPVSSTTSLAGWTNQLTAK